MPACHLRHDRARRKRFRDDPPLVRVTPPSPATNATANLDAPSRMLFSDLPLELLCDGALSLRSSRRGFVIMAGEALIALTIVVTGMYLLI